MDHHAAENIARHVSMAYGQLAAFCAYVVKREMIEDGLAPGTMTLCMAVGKAFREAGGVDALSGALADEIGARELFVGRISQIELKTEGGFDFGITHIDGTEAHAGKSVGIGFKNENILMRDQSGKVMATVPDLITLVDVEMLTPLTNADTREGQRVAVYGATASANWFKTPMGFDCWKHILHKFDYDGGYVPVK